MLQEIESNFEFPNAVDTYIAAIDRIGTEVVRDLGIEVEYAPYVKNILPLIVTQDESNTIEERDRRYYKPNRDGKYKILTGISNEKKSELLEEIADRIGIDIFVEIVPK